MKTLLADDGRKRCPWSNAGLSETYLRYHDEEWGVPVHDDRTQFEFLILEGAQAGLSWSTILNKRAGYREAFADFDPERVARFNKRTVERLMKFPGIVRNRLKIESAITNARCVLAVQDEVGGFAKYLWSFVGNKPIVNKPTTIKQVPATSPESDAAQQGSAQPRVQVRRQHDHLRAHAGDGARERSHRELLPLQGHRAAALNGAGASITRLAATGAAGRRFIPAPATPPSRRPRHRRRAADAARAGVPSGSGRAATAG